MLRKRFIDKLTARLVQIKYKKSLITARLAVYVPNTESYRLPGEICGEKNDVN